MSRGLLLGTMIVLGIVALAVPAWTYEARTGRPLGVTPAPASAQRPLESLAAGTVSALELAEQRLRAGRRSDAARALDAARRAARVGGFADTHGAFAETLKLVRGARDSLQDGRPSQALASVQRALATLRPDAVQMHAPNQRLDRYVGATVIDATGVRIGEVVQASGEQVEIALGGGRDVLGLFDLERGTRMTVNRGALVLGPRRWVGATLVAWPAAARATFASR